MINANARAPHDSSDSDVKEPKLVLLNGPCRGRVFSLGEGRTRIGRHPDNDIIIDMGHTVSSAHAVVYRDGEGSSWWVRDRDSKNGTYVNDQRVDRARLRDEDTLTLARNGPEMRFTFGEPKVPGLLEATWSTFRKTHSVTEAVGELLPAMGGRRRGITGVERILDDRLERLQRRTQWLFLSTLVGMLCLAVIAVAVLFSAMLGKDGGGPGAETSLVTGANSKIAVDIAPKLEPIYSSLFFSSREHPIGTITVTNRGEESLDELALSFEFRKEAADYLTEPFRATIPLLAPGVAKDIDILPRISDKIRSERTYEVTAVIRVLRGDEVIKEVVRGVYVLGYNVFNWEEPRRIATFIDPQDPAVKALVNEVMRRRPADSASAVDFPPKAFRNAVLLLTALSRLELRYVPDAETPISTKIDEKASDQVSFPWETLLAGTGDCDDLSVLCASVLEAAGIPTAIAVGPTHVLVMFDSGVDVATLESTPLDPSSVVVWSDRVWVPIETTRLGAVGTSFTTVWSAAWSRREHIASGEMEVVHVRAAWRDFPPSPMKELDERAEARIAETRWVGESSARALGDALDEIKRVFHQNLQRKVEEIEESTDDRIERDRAVGLLYTRGGLYARARTTFERVLFDEARDSELDLRERLEDLPRTSDRALLLFDLGIVMSLGAKSPSDLEDAARCIDAGLDRLSGGRESPLAPRYLLRLGLVHRLRGDIAASRRATDLAFAAAPNLRETWDAMVGGTGIGGRASEDGADAAWRRFLARGAGTVTKRTVSTPPRAPRAPR